MGFRKDSEDEDKSNETKGWDTMSQQLWGKNTRKEGNYDHAIK